MQLSAEIYLQLVESLRSEPRRGREMRTSARVGVGGQLSIQLVASRGAKQSFLVRIRDLSVDGIGIVASRRMPVGTQFLVVFPRSKGGDELLLVCEVRRCDKAADDVYNIGARFISDNAADDRFGVGKKAKSIRQTMFS